MTKWTNKNVCKLRYIMIVVIVLACIITNIVSVPSVRIAKASSAGAMIVMETTTNRILNQRNAYTKRYMASTTKIVTAITVINNTDVQAIVTVPKQAVGVEGSSIYLELGEKIKVIDLLYGLMLQSGNDAAVALAIHVSSSVTKFAELMNKTAQDVGATNSNFVNPHGLHHDDHYTTAYDLGLISAYALRNEIFAKIVATKSHTVYREVKGWKHIINNKNKILYTFEGGDGVKTGFTKRAGRCLVSSATREGMQVVCVVLNCGPMFEECRALMARAYQQYKLVNILPSYAYVGVANVSNGRQDQVGAYSHKAVYYPLRDDEMKQVTKLIEFDNIAAPITKDQKIGKIVLKLYDRVLSEQKLYSMSEVQSISVMDKLRQLLPDWLG